MINTHVNINGINFNLYNNAELISIIKKSISNCVPTKIFYLNAYLFSSVINIEELKNILNSGLVINDGIGINLFLKFILWNKNIDRTVTTDIWDWVLNLCSDFHQKIIIYGGKENRKHEIMEFLKKYPGIKLIRYSDGYSNFDVSKYKADIIFVGLGSFRQEYYIENISNNFQIPVKIAVGSAIDYWSGAKIRAPLWMRKMGFEWLYRLFQEPKRLWKRYILGIPIFIFNVVLLKVKLMFNKEST